MGFNLFLKAPWFYNHKEMRWKYSLFCEIDLQKISIVFDTDFLYY